MSGTNMRLVRHCGLFGVQVLENADKEPSHWLAILLDLAVNILSQ